MMTIMEEVVVTDEEASVEVVMMVVLAWIDVAEEDSVVVLIVMVVTDEEASVEAIKKGSLTMDFASIAKKKVISPEIVQMAHKVVDEEDLTEATEVVEVASVVTEEVEEASADHQENTLENNIDHK